MIVVTAPTGQIGRQVVEQLLAANASVRVIARDPSRLAPDVRRRVDVVVGSHGDPAVVQDAFAGAEAVFWLVLAPPTAANALDAYVDFTRPAAAALRAQGVGRVVNVSALGRGTPQAAHAGLVTASLAMDDLIASTGVRFRALANPSFFDNLLRQVEPIRTRGVFYSAVDVDRKLPACATRDIASVAARLLLDDTWHGQAEVPVLGPEDLSFADMAAIMSDVLGRAVRCERISYDAYKSQFVQRGASESVAQAMVDMARAKSEGLDNGAPRTPACSTPTTFRQWCDETLAPAVNRPS